MSDTSYETSLALRDAGAPQDRETTAWASKAEARIETWQVRAEAYRQSADAAGIALLRAEAERDEMERKLNRYLAAMREWVDDGSAPRAIRAIVEEVKP